MTHYEFLAAVRRYRCGSPGMKLVLIVLAEHAGYDPNRDEWSCIPGQQILADQSEQSMSTVRRHIRALEDAGVITTELRYGKDGKRTSSTTVFRTSLLPVNLTSSNGALPVNGDQTRGQQVTSKEPEEEPVLSSVPPDGGTCHGNGVGFPTPAAIRTGTPYPDAFEAFWAEYPRKLGKTAAYKAWLARLNEGKRAGVPIERRTEYMIAAARNYAAAVVGRDTEHIKHASTFLGPSEHWKDYARTAAPEAGARRPTQGKEFWE